MRIKLISKIFGVFLALMACVLLFGGNKPALAASPTTVNFQGKVVNSDGTNVSNGTYSFIFRIYNTSSPTPTAACSGDSTCLFEETQSSVTVTNGTFQVELGSTCAGGLVAANTCTKSASGGLNFGSNNALYLTLQFNGDTSGTHGGFMWPVIHFTSVPYAYYADSANNASNLGGISSSNFVQFATGTLQADTSTNSSISVNKTGASGDILLLEASSKKALEVNNSGTTLLGQAGASGLNGTLTFNNSVGSNTVSLSLQANPGTSYTLLLPTTGPSTSQCLQTDASVANQLTFAACSTGGSSALADTYNSNATSGNTITLASAGGPVVVQDNSSPLVGSLFTVMSNSCALSSCKYLDVSSSGISVTGLTANGNIAVAASNYIKIAGSGTRPSSPAAGTLYYDTTTNQLVKYNGTKWTSAPKSNTEIVAASDSSQAEKDAADFVATGSDDGATINNALNALPTNTNNCSTTGCGSVYLMEGTYTLGTTAISMPNNTTLSGAGSSTLLKFASNVGAGTYYAIMNSDTSTGTRVNIQNLMINGGSQTTGTFYGIYLNGVGSGIGFSARDGGKVTNVVVRNLYKGSSIYLDNSSNNALAGNTLQSNSGTSYGINLSGSLYNTITGNNIGGSSYGIYLSGSSNSNTISGDNAAGGLVGVYLSGSSSNTITGDTAIGGSQGIYLYNSSNNNTVASNSVQGGTGSNYGAIYIQSSSSNTITGNTAQSSDYGIYMASSSYNTISGNTVQGNALSGVILSSSSSNILDGNKIHNNGGSTDNNGFYLSSSSQNTITGNDITDTSCTTTCYAIDISSSSSNKNYLSNNRYSGSTSTGASIIDSGTNTIYANQQTNTTTSTNGDVTDFTIRGSANSATAFQIQTAGATDTLLTADTSANKIVIGNATGTNTSTTLLVIDSASADPATGFNGAEYYNTINNKFRCYQNGGWTDCISGSGTLASTYNSAATTGNAITLTSAGGPVAVQDNSTPLTGSLFTVMGNACAVSSCKYLDVSSGGISVTNETVVAGGYIKITGSGTLPSSPTDGTLYYDTANHELLVYNSNKNNGSGGWQASRSIATKIVAASNSSQADKDSADYIASGSSDQTTINNALNALPLGGGVVYLLEGTYTVTGSISIPNNTVLTGTGPNTLITIPNGSNGQFDIITNKDTSTGTRVTVQNLKIDGNEANIGASGFNTAVYFNHVGSVDANRNPVLGGGLINNVIAANLYDGIPTGAIELSNSNNTNVENCDLENTNHSVGILIYGENNMALNNTVNGSNPSGGIQIGSYNNTVAGNTIKNAVGNGLSLSGSINGNVYGNIIDNTVNSGIDIWNNSTYNVVSNNTVMNSGVDGIYLVDSTSNNLSGNVIGTSAISGIILDQSFGTTRYNLISSNRIYDSGGSTDNNGLAINSGNYNTVTSNNISDSSCSGTCVAIYAGSLTVGNTFSANTITGLPLPATVSDSGNNTYQGQMLTSTGDSTFRAQVSSTTSFQVQNSVGVAVLNVDTSRSTTTFVGSNSTSTASLGGELVTSQAFNNATYWTCTGWSTTATTAQHTTGNTTACSATATNFAVTASATYQISFQLAGNTNATNTVAVSIGAVSAPAIGQTGTNTQTVVLRSSTTGALTFTPTLSFNGTISNISVMLINTATSQISVNSYSGGGGFDVRTNNAAFGANIYIGTNSGYATTSAYENTAVGNGSLQSTTTGQFNTATGYDSLMYNTTGLGNAAVGVQSLQNNISGNSNAALGAATLMSNTTGSNNTAVGTLALGNNNTGSNNTAIGYEAGYSDPGTTSFATLSNLQNATMVGYGAEAQASNVLILGGVGSTSSSLTPNVGIGTTSPDNIFTISPDIYDTGTAAVTSGSAAVTGTGTLWSTTGGQKPGAGMDFIFADGSKYTIQSVNSDTSITLTSNATATETASAYRIHSPNFYVSSTGNTQVRTSTNSTTAFMVQNAANTSVFSVNTSTAGISITGGLTQTTGAVSITGNAASSIGTSSGNLTVNSGGGTLVLGSNTTTLQKAASTFTFDVSNGASASTLNISNSGGAGNITLNLDSGGSFAVGGTSGTTAAACSAGQFITGSLSGGIVTSGSCGGTTLQNAYDASSNPAVITTSSGGKSITFAAGAAQTDDLFTVDAYNGSNTVSTTGLSGLKLISPKTSGSSGFTYHGLDIEGPGSQGVNDTDTGLYIGTGWDIGVDINSGGIQLATQSDPSAPAAGELRIYAKDIAGRVLPKWIGPAGVDTPVQASFGFNRISMMAPAGSGTNCGTGMSSYGATGVGSSAGSATGCSYPTLAGTNLATSIRRFRYTTGTTAGTLGFQRQAATMVWRGSSAGQGGFFFTTRFTMNTLQSGNRAFVGLADSIATPTNIDPTTNTTPGKIGLAINTNSGNWKFVNNITGTAPTVTDLTSSIPVNTTDLLELAMFSAPNGTSIGYRVTDISTGGQISGSVNSNIPATSTFLAPLFWVSNNATAAAVIMDNAGWYLESDN